MALKDWFRRKKTAKASDGGARTRWPTKGSGATWTRGDYTMHNSELLFAAVSRISNALSVMPIQLYRDSRPVKNDLAELMRFAPNPCMTSCQWLKTMEACRCTYGNAYSLKILDEKGAVQSLDVLDPARVRPIIDRDSRELWYQITPESGQTIYVHSFYVLHIPFLSANGCVGVNPVSVLFDTLSYAENIQKFSVEQLDKGINASVVLDAPGNLGPEQKQKAVETFKATYKETGGSILFLESGLRATTLNLSPVDSRLFEVEKITRSKVAMVYNLPPHLLGDYSDTSFSSQEQQMLEFLQLTMLPIVMAYEQELDRKLLTGDQRRRGMGFRLNMDAILRADALTQASVYEKSVRGGWVKPNEARSTYNRPPEPEGNKLLASRDLTTLEYIVQNPDKTPIGGRNGQN